MLMPAVSKTGSPLVPYGLMNMNESNVTKSASSFQSSGDLQRRICCNSLRYRATGSIAGCMNKIVRRWVASDSKTGDVIRPDRLSPVVSPSRKHGNRGQEDWSEGEAESRS